IENARVTATVYDSIITQGPFCKCCTTFTNSNGFYSFDSLWPVRYWMTASFGNHPPIGELSPSLCALWEKHLNFYFVDIEEPGVETFNPSASLIIFPNPFRNHCVIKFQIPNNSAIRNPQSEISLKIHDVSGRVVRQFNHLTIQPFNQVVWDGCDNLGRMLSPGIYFVRLEFGDYRQIEKAVLLR
ncbi:MAG: T9SS type A sorting domain-containing protein, partial [candidate division WOR-3 bacterium]